MSRFVLIAAFCFLITACNSVLDTREDLADEIQVVIDGQTSTQLLLVTSTDWDFVTNNQSGEREFRLFAADTATLALPFQRTYQFTQTRRFLARVVNPDSTQTASIRLRLVLEGRNVCDQSATLRDASFQCTWRYF